MFAAHPSMTSMRSTFCGARVQPTSFGPVCPSRSALTIEGAHKTGAGSTKNGRDSVSKRRGIKVYGGQEVKSGGIIVRQVGATWKAGNNVGLGKDYTLFSLVPGIVRFEKKKHVNQVSVYPFESELALSMVAATHTTKPKEGVPSRAERRKSAYTPRAKQRAEASAVAVAAAAASVSP